MVKYLLLFVFSMSLYASEASRRYEILSGVKKQGPDDKSFWDTKYSRREYVYGKVPAKFLAENEGYLKERGRVLDIGMGEGRNAVYLATRGFEVVGIDISSIAVKKSKMLATEFGVSIDGVVGDVSKYDFKKESFDAIIVFYYVDRSLKKRILSWLKPGGILIYESYTDHQLKVKGYESYSKDYLLRPGELLSMFLEMRILKYEEPKHLKDFTASAILEKP